jgi:hypothetical protein
VHRGERKSLSTHFGGHTKPSGPAKLSSDFLEQDTDDVESDGEFPESDDDSVSGTHM